MARFLPALRSKALDLPLQYSGALGPLNREQKALVGEYLAAVVGQMSAAYGADGRRRPRRWEVERAVAEGYERIVWVYKSVDAIAGNCAALPFWLLDGDNPVTDHPLIELLNGPRANPMETGHELRERLSAQVLLSRRGAFVEVGMNRRNMPHRLDLLPPGRTQPIPGDKDEPVKGFLVTLADGKRRLLDPETVLWFRKPH
ncbi:MAG: phage portal protein, partial [Pseudonocardiales bacterium]|nr:phage portal protein [Pseudonocardiales bacterium]